MDVALKDERNERDRFQGIVPREYEAYCRIVEHPPKGLEIRQKYLGVDGFPNWLKELFEAQRQADERDGY
ncbi:MAG TPA: hypothetical protein VE422_46555 [Terriglobia bacterium]|nr:hypothetical protein [Terriglobia bacterium]